MECLKSVSYFNFSLGVFLLLKVISVLVQRIPFDVVPKKPDLFESKDRGKHSLLEKNRLLQSQANFVAIQSLFVVNLI